MAIRRIADAGGNWNSTSTWVENLVPTSFDDVQATLTSGPITGGGVCVCKSIDLTLYTKGTLSNAPNWIIRTSGVDVNGYMVRIPSNVALTGANIECTGAVGGKIAIGSPILELRCQSTGTYNLQADLNCTRLYLGYTNSGSAFHTNDYNITCGGIYINNSASQTTFWAGTSTFYINSPDTYGYIIESAGGIEEYMGVNNAHIVIRHIGTADKPFGNRASNTSSCSYHDIILLPPTNSKAIIFDRGMSLSSLEVQAGAQLKMSGSNNLVVMGKLSIIGTVGSRQIFGPSSGVTTLYGGSPTIVDVRYTDIQNINADISNGDYWVADKNSTLTNTTNWRIADDVTDGMMLGFVA